MTVIVENLNKLVTQLDRAGLPTAKGWVREAISELGKLDKFKAVNVELDQARKDLSDALNQIRQMSSNIDSLVTRSSHLNNIIDAAAKHWLSLDPGVPYAGGLDGAMQAAVGEIVNLRRQKLVLEDKIAQYERAIEDLCAECPAEEVARIVDLHPILEDKA